jgi:catechol 2,3-dioxygenase-like lactoylglutathione lyase family enzyme
MSAYVEHANITIKQLENTIHFLQTAIPEFEIRKQGQGDHYRWCHLGTKNSYIALQEVVEREESNRTPYLDIGINHIGIVIDSVSETRARLIDAGYQENELGADHPWRKRIYFFDKDGIEWEFIEYLSDDPAQRNDYSL